LPDRLRSATARMEKIPPLLAQSRENLDPHAFRGSTRKRC
jgi:hypothetical protein